MFQSLARACSTRGQSLMLAGAESTLALLLSASTLSGPPRWALEEAQTAWPFRRCSSPGPPAPQVPKPSRVSAHSLTPVSHPHQPQARTVGGGRPSGRRTCRAWVFKRAPMYQCTGPHQGHTSPPVDPSPKVRSPMSPKYPGILVPPPLPPSPGPCLLSCTRHAMYGLSLAGPGEPYWGPQDRPPPGPGRRDGRRGYIETSPPQSRSVRLTLLALISKHHQPSPTTATNTPHLDHPDQP